MVTVVWDFVSTAGNKDQNGVFVVLDKNKNMYHYIRPTSIMVMIDLWLSLIDQL